MLVVVLHLLLLLHAVHVVQDHLLGRDLLRVHCLLRRVLRLLQMHLLVLSGSPSLSFAYLRVQAASLTL